MNDKKQQGNGEIIKQLFSKVAINLITFFLSILVFLFFKFILMPSQLEIIEMKIKPDTFFYFCKENVPRFYCTIITNGKKGSFEYEIIHNTKEINSKKIPFECERGKSEYRIDFPNIEWREGVNTIQVVATIIPDDVLRFFEKIYKPKMQTKQVNRELEVLTDSKEGYVLICGDEQNPAFYIMEKEVSISKFRTFTGGPVPEMPLYRHIDTIYEEHYAVLNARWQDAECYCEQIENARLPTSDEWELAYKGTAPHSVLSLPNNCRYLGVFSMVDTDNVEYRENGVFNLNCNAKEWKYDWYNESRSLKTVRGAGGFDPFAKPEKKYWADYRRGHNEIGFRCALNKNKPLPKHCER